MRFGSAKMEDFNTVGLIVLLASERGRGKSHSRRIELGQCSSEGEVLVSALSD